MSLSARIKWKMESVFVRLLNAVGETRYFRSRIKAEEVKRITVIVVGRNDNYGGEFSLRLQTTLDWNLKHLPDPELIYVEWNRIPGKPSDCEWIEKRYPGSKCFIVPEEIHREISASPDRMKVMEYFAKNIGIRKASTDWIMLINADVFIGPDVIRRIRHLNRNCVYATHYNNIIWDKQPIRNEHFENKKLLKTYFSAFRRFGATVGNFILTHRENWLKATGYDESLNMVRAGVDSNGYFQLKTLHLKSVIIGNHFHLDHPESIINVSGQESHGETSIIAKHQNVPYHNKDNWGLIQYPLKQLSGNIWELQKI